MKIIVVTLDYPPNRFIGAEIAVHRLVKRLLARGHTVEVRVTAGIGGKWEGVRSVPHRTAPLWNPDVVVSNVGLGVRVRELWGEKVPRVLWTHNNQLGALLDLSEADPEILVTNTHHMRSAVLSTTGIDSRVLYPIPDSGVRPLEARGDRWLLVNGSREKGGLVVRDVAETLLDQKFLVVQGGHGTHVQQTAPNVKSIPHTPDLSEIWAQACGLLIPSLAESYSMVGFEALQRGLPVVASALPGVMEALGPQEQYVAPGRRPEDWVEALTHRIPDYKSRRARHVARRLEQVEEQVESLCQGIEDL